MYNDSMFNSLKDSKELSYMEEHPYVYIRSGNLIMQYEVFSAYEAATDSPAEDRQLLIDYFLQHSEADAGIRPVAANGNKILTLSTCSQDGPSDNRWVVHCVLNYVLELEE